MRLSVVCGARALEAAQAMRARQADIGALLSAKADQTAVAVHRGYDEYTALKFTHFGVCSQLFDALAQLAGPGEDAIRTVPGLDPDGLHRLAVRLTEATTGLCAALTPTEKGTGYCIAQADGDVRALTKALNAALNGRGGGKPGICQGSCAAAPEQVEAFLRETGITLQSTLMALPDSPFVAARHPFPSLSPTVTFLPGAGRICPGRGSLSSQGASIAKPNSFPSYGQKAPPFRGSCRANARLRGVSQHQGEQQTMRMRFKPYAHDELMAADFHVHER